MNNNRGGGGGGGGVEEEKGPETRTGGGRGCYNSGQNWKLLLMHGFPTSFA